MPAKKESAKRDEIALLRLRLQEAEDTLEAIRSGSIDALLVTGEAGEQVFTLKGAEHGYRLFVEGMHEGAVTLRSDGLILHCNLRFASLLGMPLTKVIGGNFSELVVSHEMEELRRFLSGTDNHQCRLCG
jgi:PAS domain-containing protein